MSVKSRAVGTGVDPEQAKETETEQRTWRRGLERSGDHVAFGTGNSARRRITYLYTCLPKEASFRPGALRGEVLEKILAARCEEVPEK